MTRIPAGIGHRICSHAVAWVTALMLAVAMVCIPQAVAMDDGTATDAVTVDINTATAPVTAQSGYHLTLDITNPTDHALPASSFLRSARPHNHPSPFVRTGELRRALKNRLTQF